MGMTRVDEFLAMFNRLAEHLSRLSGQEPGTSFSKLVERASLLNPTIKRHQFRLKAFGRLRNAIVHGASYPYEVVAEPTDGTLRGLGDLVKEVLTPAPLIPAFQREVRCFAPDDALAPVLHYMRENLFSQVAVRVEGRLQLLTSEGIAWWFAEAEGNPRRRGPDGTVRDALALEESEAFVILSQDSTVDHAREAFASEIDRGQPRLYAILITATGKATEDPLGIVTPWDLLGAADA